MQVIEFLLAQFIRSPWILFLFSLTNNSLLRTESDYKVPEFIPIGYLKIE